MRYLFVLFFAVAALLYVFRAGDVSYATLAFVAFTLAWLIARAWLTDSDPIAVKSSEVDGRERALLAFVLLGMIFLPLIALATPVLDFARYEPGWIAFVAGVAAGGLGLYLFYRSHVDLGRFWSPTLETRQGHMLVTNGIYGRIRHPMYTAIFLICIAQALLMDNWVAGPAGLLTFVMLYLFRVGREEAMMRDEFGQAYTEYEKATPRLVPKLK
ncbi:MAG: protein-S-isoprenylcysteine O-methyltransferase [Pseudomonadota bacterium]